MAKAWPPGFAMRAVASAIWRMGGFRLDGDKTLYRKYRNIGKIILFFGILIDGRDKPGHDPSPEWRTIYLFIATRHGVSGKELQRTLGVTYKTAYRIGMQIRDLMGKVDSFQTLKGHVEIDETYFGGYRPRSQGGKDAKTIIMGHEGAGRPD